MVHRTLLFILCLPTFLLGQIRITTDQLPQVGDTLWYAVDNLPGNIQVGVPGENLRWDFSSLQAPYVRRTIWQAASGGIRSSDFPTANLRLPLGENAEAYYEKTSDGRLFQRGGVGQDPLELGIEGVVQFARPILSRRAPLRYGDQYEHTYALQQTIPASALPQRLRDELPITPDSFRVSLEGERFDVVDAWGRMIIPGGYFDVLREKRVTTQRLKLEARLGRFPWADITDLLRPEDFPNERQITEYVFFSNEIQQPVAMVEMGPQERFVKRVTYGASPLTTNVQNISEVQPGVYAFPNPAIIHVRFEFTDLPAGNYELAIRNILGKVVWRKDYYIDGNLTERIDISSLRKGTYLYSLKDQAGKILTTKRLVVVRP